MPIWRQLIARAKRYFGGGSTEFWLDELTVTELKAQNKELRLRPPIEEFASGYFKYEPAIDDEPSDESGQSSEPVEYCNLPEFE